MVKVKNGKIVQTYASGPGYVGGRFVSELALIDKNILKADGWYEPVEVRPVYNPEFEKLSEPVYTYEESADIVIATYSTVDSGEAELLRRVEALEADSTELKGVLIEKQIVEERDFQPVLPDKPKEL